MTKAGGANLSDPLLARKGEAAPTGYRCAGPLPAEPANSNETDKGMGLSPDPSPAPETPLLEPGEPTSLLACVPLKASFIGLEAPDSDELLEDAEPELPAIKGDTVEAAANLTMPAAGSARQSEGSVSRRLFIVLSLAVLLALGWLGLKMLAQESGVNEPPQDPAAVTAPQPATVREPAETTESVPADAVPEAQETASPAPQPIEPTFDVVRIEANGDAVIVGRGPAFSELVILDNGQPIGTVKADASGQWILIPDMPLNQGGHNFSLAVKSDNSTVILPEPDTVDDAEPLRLKSDEPAEMPGREDQSRLESDAPVQWEAEKLAGAEPLTPLPLRKPASMAGLGAEGKLSGAYEIQLVSVPSVDGASREMQRLKRDFPEVLANLNLRIDEKTYDDQRRQYRVRTGPFVDKLAAEALCERLNAGQQDCLVLKR